MSVVETIRAGLDGGIDVALVSLLAIAFIGLVLLGVSELGKKAGY